eukprot:4114221-Amphidinium_carterae.1
MSPANFHDNKARNCPANGGKPCPLLRLVLFNKPLPCREPILFARVDDQRKRLLSTKKKQYVIQLNRTTRISWVQTTIGKASRNFCFYTGHQSSKSLVDARTL